MRPALLLDLNLAHALADALRRHRVDVEHLADWRAGALRTASDQEILAAAATDERVVVSYDTATLPAIAFEQIALGQPHAGLLVISSRINQQDIGGQLLAILRVLDEVPESSWMNHVAYAHRI